MISAGDTDNCCVNEGSCQTPEPITSECEEQGGTCRISCESDEEEIFYECEFEGDSCCVFKTTGKKSYTWIWILLILIVLVVIGIIFKNKLRNLWFKMGSKFGKSKSGPRPGPPRRPPGPPHYPVRRPVRERRILPSLQQPVMPGKTPSRSQKELDDVLRKLKEMGK